MERNRPVDSIDKLRWYCHKGNHSQPTVIHEEAFHCEDLGTQLKVLIEKWQRDEGLRRCKECGEVAEPM